MARSYGYSNSLGDLQDRLGINPGLGGKRQFGGSRERAKPQDVLPPPGGGGGDGKSGFDWRKWGVASLGYSDHKAHKEFAEHEKKHGRGSWDIWKTDPGKKSFWVGRDQNKYVFEDPGMSGTPWLGGWHNIHWGEGTRAPTLDDLGYKDTWTNNPNAHARFKIGDKKAGWELRLKDKHGNFRTNPDGSGVWIPADMGLSDGWGVWWRGDNSGGMGGNTGGTTGGQMGGGMPEDMAGSMGDMGAMGSKSYSPAGQSSRAGQQSRSSDSSPVVGVHDLDRKGIGNPVGPGTSTQDISKAMDAQKRSRETEQIVDAMAPTSSGSLSGALGAKRPTEAIDEHGNTTPLERLQMIMSAGPQATSEGGSARDLGSVLNPSATTSTGAGAGGVLDRLNESRTISSAPAQETSQQPSILEQLSQKRTSQPSQTLGGTQRRQPIEGRVDPSTTVQDLLQGRRGGSRDPNVQSNAGSTSQRPQTSGFISPYGLARMQGFQGSFEEWLQTEDGRKFQEMSDRGVMW